MGHTPRTGNSDGITRLQLGTSRLERLDAQALKTFLQPAWLHLGDAVQKRKSLREIWSEYTIPQMAEVLCSRAKRVATSRSNAMPISQTYANTNFQTWFFTKGDRLPVVDATVDYIFSEHFFEHLFLDDAVALLLECRRALKPNGVIRTVVPDADLRTYAAPEKAGYPNPRLTFAHPKKHRTRWSVYMLSEVLRLAGFKAIPLRYCTAQGEYIRRDPAALSVEYSACPDWPVVSDLSHVMKIDSLIVDGIRV